VNVARLLLNGRTAAVRQLDSRGACRIARHAGRCDGDLVHTKRREIEMAGNRTTYPPEVLTAVCRELVKLAREEENRAADDAAAHRAYWEPMPLSVAIHREAAAALRAGLARLEAELRSASPSQQQEPRDIPAQPVTELPHRLPEGRHDRLHVRQQHLAA
jgi:hypothetical protein